MFIVKPDKTVEMRNVVVERQAGDDTVIKDGLKPGETVVDRRPELRLVGGPESRIKSGPGAPSAKVEP